MILIPEQICCLRQQKEKLTKSLETYQDYLKNKEIVSSDTTARLLIGDAFTEDEYHRERDNLHKITELLENSHYLKERSYDKIEIGTKFVVKFAGSTQTSTMILTDSVWCLGYTDGFVSIQSPLGTSVLGKTAGSKFSYKVPITRDSFNQREILGSIVEIKTNPKDYICFITQRPKTERISRKQKMKLHNLSTGTSADDKQELATYQTITQSQKYLLEVEMEKLKRRTDPSSKSRLAVVRKLLTSPVVSNISDDKITVGSKFDLAITAPGEDLNVYTYEMINNAVGDELQTDYLERISPLGEKVYGLKENDLFEFYKDRKKYTGQIIGIHSPKTNVKQK